MTPKKAFGHYKCVLHGMVVLPIKLILVIHYFSPQRRLGIISEDVPILVNTNNSNSISNVKTIEQHAPR